jgi:epsilon-lactone hydrolase
MSRQVPELSGSAGVATMASEESQANKAHYERLVALAASGNRPSPEEGDVIWGNLTKEPEALTISRSTQVACLRSGSFQTDAPLIGLCFTRTAVRCRWLHPVSSQDGCASRQGRRVPGADLRLPLCIPAKTSRATGCDVQAYRWLLAEGIEPRHIACAGDSIGAVLVFGLLQRARSSALPLPAAIMIISG